MAITLIEQLAQLESSLRTILPKAKAVAPKAQTLEKLAALIGKPRPELAKLWSWGLAPQVFGAGDLGFDDEETWLTPDQALRALKELRKAPQFSRTFVPLSTDEAGNYTCLDNGTGAIMDWDHETRATRVYSKTLEAFIAPRRIKATRAVKERNSAAAHVPSAAASAGAMPKGLKRVPNADLTRFDAKGYGGGAEAAAMSHDGRWITIAFRSSTMLWDLEKKRQVEFDGRFRSSSLIGFDPTGPRGLFAGTYQGRILELESGAVKHHWRFDDNRAVRGGFSHDGALVYCLAQNALSIWRVADLPKQAGPKKLKPLVRVAPKSPDGYCLDVGLTDDGRFLLLRSVNRFDFEVTLGAAATGKVLGKRVMAGWGRSIAIAPDGSKAAVGMRDGSIQFLSGDKLEPGKVIKSAHAKGDGVTGLAFDHTGRVLVSTGKETVKLWDASTLEPLGSEAAKSKNDAAMLRLSAVNATRVLTAQPLALFELRY